MVVTPILDESKKLFEKLKGRSDAFVNKRSGEIFVEDLYHKDHYEVYKNKNDLEKGKRSSARYWNGQSRNLANNGHNCC